MKIGIVGLGKMGPDYLDKAIKKQGTPAHDVVIWDIVPERIKAMVEKYPGVVVASSLEDFARNAETFIVAVNTPAHHEVIHALAEHGAKHVLCESGITNILCEKPLAQNVIQLRKIRALERRFPQMTIHTALVIQFSAVFDVLHRLIRDEDLVLVEMIGNWGKNRGMAKETRPTAGDRVDEFLWMLEAFMALIRHQGIRHATIHSAMCGFLNYANEESQHAAHARDDSFPLTPDHATSATMSFATDLERDIRVTLASSFLLPKQRRNIAGILKQRDTNEPVILFEVEFDQKDGDHLLITRCRTNEQETFILPRDKLNVMTDAFMQYAQNGIACEALASVEQAAICVEILDAIGENDRLRRMGTAQFQKIFFRQDDVADAIRA